MLDAVSDLKANCVNSTSIEVSFNPPSTLDGVPIRNYKIDFATNDITSNDTGIIDSFTITGTIVVLTIPESCDNYSIVYIAVAAWNDVGRGIISQLEGTVHLHNHIMPLMLPLVHNKCL